VIGGRNGCGGSRSRARCGCAGPHYDFTLTLAAIVGLLRLRHPALARRRWQRKPLRIAAVQAQRGRGRKKFSREFQAKNVSPNLTGLTRLALATPAAPAIDRLAGKARRLPARRLLDEGKLPVRDGSLRFDQDGTCSSARSIEIRNGDYNAALARLEGRREYSGFYRKLHLVPFGEYVPGPAHPCPSFQRFVGDQVPGDFTRGKRAGGLSPNDPTRVKVAPLICFEDTLGELTRLFVLRGRESARQRERTTGWVFALGGAGDSISRTRFSGCVRNPAPDGACGEQPGVTCFSSIAFGRVTQVLLDTKGSQFTEGVLTGSLDIPVSGETNLLQPATASSSRKFAGCRRAAFPASTIAPIR